MQVPNASSHYTEKFNLTMQDLFWLRVVRRRMMENDTLHGTTDRAVFSVTTSKWKIPVVNDSEAVLLPANNFLESVEEALNTTTSAEATTASSSGSTSFSTTGSSSNTDSASQDPHHVPINNRDLFNTVIFEGKGFRVNTTSTDFCFVADGSAGTTSPQQQLPQHEHTLPILLDQVKLLKTWEPFPPGLYAIDTQRSAWNTTIAVGGGMSTSSTTGAGAYVDQHSQNHMLTFPTRHAIPFNVLNDDANYAKLSYRPPSITNDLQWELYKRSNLNKRSLHLELLYGTEYYVDFLNELRRNETNLLLTAQAIQQQEGGNIAGSTTTVKAPFSVNVSSPFIRVPKIPAMGMNSGGSWRIPGKKDLELNSTCSAQGANEIDLLVKFLSNVSMSANYVYEQRTATTTTTTTARVFIFPSILLGLNQEETEEEKLAKELAKLEEESLPKLWKGFVESAENHDSIQRKSDFNISKFLQPSSHVTSDVFWLHSENFWSAALLDGDVVGGVGGGNTKTSLSSSTIDSTTSTRKYCALLQLPTKFDRVKIKDLTATMVANLQETRQIAAELFYLRRKVLIEQYYVEEFFLGFRDLNGQLGGSCGTGTTSDGLLAKIESIQAFVQARNEKRGIYPSSTAASSSSSTSSGGVSNNQGSDADHNTHFEHRYFLEQRAEVLEQKLQEAEIYKQTVRDLHGISTSSGDASSSIRGEDVEKKLVAVDTLPLLNATTLLTSAATSTESQPPSSQQEEQAQSHFNFTAFHLDLQRGNTEFYANLMQLKPSCNTTYHREIYLPDVSEIFFQTDAILTDWETYKLQGGTTSSSGGTGTTISAAALAAGEKQTPEVVDLLQKVCRNVTKPAGSATSSSSGVATSSGAALTSEDHYVLHRACTHTAEIIEIAAAGNDTTSNSGSGAGGTAASLNAGLSTCEKRFFFQNSGERGGPPGGAGDASGATTAAVDVDTTLYQPWEGNETGTDKTFYHRLDYGSQGGTSRPAGGDSSADEPSVKSNGLNLVPVEELSSFPYAAAIQASSTGGGGSSTSLEQPSNTIVDPSTTSTLESIQAAHLSEMATHWVASSKLRSSSGAVVPQTTALPIVQKIPVASSSSTTSITGPGSGSISATQTPRPLKFFELRLPFLFNVTFSAQEMEFQELRNFYVREYPVCKNNQLSWPAVSKLHPRLLAMTTTSGLPNPLYEKNFQWSFYIRFQNAAAKLSEHENFWFVKHYRPLETTLKKFGSTVTELQDLIAPPTTMVSSGSGQVQQLTPAAAQSFTANQLSTYYTRLSERAFQSWIIQSQLYAIRVEFTSGTFDNATLEMEFMSRSTSDELRWVARSPAGFDFGKTTVESLGVPMSQEVLDAIGGTTSSDGTSTGAGSSSSSSTPRSLLTKDEGQHQLTVRGQNLRGSPQLVDVAEAVRHTGDNHDDRSTLVAQPQPRQLQTSLADIPREHLAFTKVPVVVARRVKNEIHLFFPYLIPATSSTRIKLRFNSVTLPSIGGETSFDFQTFYRGELMDESLSCCSPNAGGPSAADADPSTGAPGTSGAPVNPNTPFESFRIPRKIPILFEFLDSVQLTPALLSTFIRKENGMGLHPVESSLPVRYGDDAFIQLEFLASSDFQYINPATGMLVSTASSSSTQQLPTVLEIVSPVREVVKNAATGEVETEPLYDMSQILSNNNFQLRDATECLVVTSQHPTYPVELFDGSCYFPLLYVKRVYSTTASASSSAAGATSTSTTAAPKQGRLAFELVSTEAEMQQNFYDLLLNKVQLPKHQGTASTSGQNTNAAEKLPDNYQKDFSNTNVEQVLLEERIYNAALDQNAQNMTSIVHAQEILYQKLPELKKLFERNRIVFGRKYFLEFKVKAPEAVATSSSGGGGGDGSSTGTVVAAAGTASSTSSSGSAATSYTFTTTSAPPAPKPNKALSSTTNWQVFFTNKNNIEKQLYPFDRGVFEDFKLYFKTKFQTIKSARTMIQMYDNVEATSIYNEDVQAMGLAPDTLNDVYLEVENFVPPPLSTSSTSSSSSAAISSTTLSSGSSSTSASTSVINVNSLELYPASKHFEVPDGLFLTSGCFSENQLDASTLATAMVAGAAGSSSTSLLQLQDQQQTQQEYLESILACTKQQKADLPFGNKITGISLTDRLKKPQGINLPLKITLKVKAKKLPWQDERQAVMSTGAPVTANTVTDAANYWYLIATTFNATTGQVTIVGWDRIVNAEVEEKLPQLFPTLEANSDKLLVKQFNINFIQAAYSLAATQVLVKIQLQLRSPLPLFGKIYIQAPVDYQFYCTGLRVVQENVEPNYSVGYAADEAGVSLATGSSSTTLLDATAAKTAGQQLYYQNHAEYYLKKPFCQRNPQTKFLQRCQQLNQTILAAQHEIEVLQNRTVYLQTLFATKTQSEMNTLEREIWRTETVNGTKAKVWNLTMGLNETKFFFQKCKPFSEVMLDFVEEKIYTKPSYDEQLLLSPQHRFDSLSTLLTRNVRVNNGQLTGFVVREDKTWPVAIDNAKGNLDILLYAQLPYTQLPREVKVPVPEYVAASGFLMSSSSNTGTTSGATTTMQQGEEESTTSLTVDYSQSRHNTWTIYILDRFQRVLDSNAHYKVSAANAPAEQLVETVGGGGGGGGAAGGFNTGVVLDKVLHQEDLVIDKVGLFWQSRCRYPNEEQVFSSLLGAPVCDEDETAEDEAFSTGGEKDGDQMSDLMPPAGGSASTTTAGGSTGARNDTAGAGALATTSATTSSSSARNLEAALQNVHGKKRRTTDNEAGAATRSREDEESTTGGPGGTPTQKEVQLVPHQRSLQSSIGSSSSSSPAAVISDSTTGSSTSATVDRKCVLPKDYYYFRKQTSTSAGSVPIPTGWTRQQAEATTAKSRPHVQRSLFHIGFEVKADILKKHQFPVISVELPDLVPVDVAMLMSKAGSGPQQGVQLPTAAISNAGSSSSNGALETVVSIQDGFQFIIQHATDIEVLTPEFPAPDWGWIPTGQPGSEFKPITKLFFRLAGKINGKSWWDRDFPGPVTKTSASQLLTAKEQGEVFLRKNQHFLINILCKSIAFVVIVSTHYKSLFQGKSALQIYLICNAALVCHAAYPSAMLLQFIIKVPVEWPRYETGFPKLKNNFVKVKFCFDFPFCLEQLAEYSVPGPVGYHVVPLQFGSSSSTNPRASSTDGASTAASSAAQHSGLWEEFQLKTPECEVPVFENTGIGSGSRGWESSATSIHFRRTGTRWSAGQLLLGGQTFSQQSLLFFGGFVGLWVLLVLT
ncbi:unnamed protein product [Amoebophrya sp. A120]|nr:unnamed protein product [Amoebophrya sp. A120]|eukprot:GSA120T00013556001.1